MTRTGLALIVLVILGLSCNRQPRPENQRVHDQQQAKNAATDDDKSPHTVHFATADNNVKLEALDWGGPGRALVLLAGLGDTADVYDEFATKLTGTYHVYGITRRGFGASSVPDTGYSADRLGDDVLAVIDSLGLTRPILVGHSIAGKELSYVGSRHPEKVAGLVYLEAAYFYAYYDRSRGNLTLDALDVRRKLYQLQPGKGIPVPVLAIYAFPRRLGPEMGDDPASRDAAKARMLTVVGAQIKAFRSGVSSARVAHCPMQITIFYRSNEADVLREINLFGSTLK